MSLSAILDEAARNAIKSLYAADLAPNKRRFFIIGFNQSRIADGNLIDLFVNLTQNAANGSYALTFSNVVATDAAGNTVSINSTDGTVMVQGTAGQGSRLSMQGVLNAASLLPGQIAPGELITLIGSAIGPPSPQQPMGAATSTALLETSVLFDGTPAPLLYAGLTQINAIVPYEVSGKSSTQLQIVNQGQTIGAQLLTVAPAVPAIFSLDSSGAGPGAILNQDSTVNSASNPAARGSVVALFATGAGQTDPPGVDGQVTGTALPSPLLSVSVQIGGVGAQVLYAGAAPALVSGVVQVNAIVPVNAPSGPAVPITLTVGATPSPAGVTLAIK